MNKRHVGILVGAVAMAAMSIGSARAATVYFDADANGANNNSITGAGLGTSSISYWNNSTNSSPLVNWWSGVGTTDQSWAVAGTDTAVFWGTSANQVWLNDAITVGGLQFNTTNYTIEAVNQPLTFTAGSTITVNGVANGYITGTVGGTGAVTITRTSATGTLTLNGTSTGGWSGATTISNGATVALASSNQALLNTSSIALGGNITLTNTSAAEAALNRVSDTAAITSTGGTITLADTSTTGINYAETIGAVTMSSGPLNLVVSTANTGTETQLLTLSGLTRTGTNNSVVAFSAAAGLDTSTRQIKVTGATATTAGQIIGPWATVGTGTGAQTDYAVYNASGNVLASGILASAETTWTTAANNYTVSGGTTLTATRTVNSLLATGAAQTLALGANNLETNGILNGGSGALTISGTGVVRQQGTAAGNLYINAGNNNITVNSVIANNTGALTLVKTGTGTLTLTGTNTYTGDTIVQEGSLQCAGGGNIYLRGNVVVGSPGGGPAAQIGATNMNTYFNTSNTSNVTVYSNGTLYFVNIPGGNINNLTIIGGTAYSAYGYVLGTITMTGGTLNGTGGVYGSNPAVVTNACAATATISVFLVGAHTFTVADGAAPIDLNVTGGIYGQYNATITKAGAGVMAIGSANTYAGATTVSGGTLLLTHALAIQNSPLTNGGTGIVFDSSVATHAFQTGGLNGSGNLALQDNATTPNPVTLTLYNNTVTSTSFTGAPTSYSGALSAAGALIKTGNGTQILSGTNTYTGTTTISAGTLQFAKEKSLYNDITASWVPTNITVSNGGTLAMNIGGTGEFTPSDVVALLGMSTATGGFTSGSSLALDTTNAPGGTYTYSNVIANTNGGSNTLGFSKLGTGTLILSGPNTYAGGTIVNGGILQSGNASAFGTTPAPLAVNAGTMDFNGTGLTVTSLSGAGGVITDTSSGTGNTALVINQSANTTYAGTVNNGTAKTLSLSKAGTGTLTMTGLNTYTGGTTITAGTLVEDTTKFASSSGTVANFLASSSPLSLGGTLSLVGRPNAATVTSTSNCFWTNPSPVITVGSTTGMIPGQLVTSATGLPAGAYIVSITDGSHFVINAPTTTFGYYATLTAAAATFTTTQMINNITLTADSIVDVQNNGGAGTTMTFGTVTGQNALTKTGTGTLSISGASTYSGVTTVSAGTLNLSNSLALQNSTLTNAGVSLPGIVFDSSVGSHAFTLGGLNATINITLADNATTANPVALSIGNNNTDTLYSGSFNGAGSVNKIGTGTLTFTSSHIYSGGTTVTAGTLVEDTSKFANSANTTVANYLSNTAPLTLNGGTLSIVGRPNASSFSTTGSSWSNASIAITCASTAGLVPGQLVSSTAGGIPSGAYVVSITDSTHFVINTSTTAAASAATVTAPIATFATSQTFNSVTLGAASTVDVQNNGGAGTTVTFNALTGTGGLTKTGTGTLVVPNLPTITSITGGELQLATNNTTSHTLANLSSLNISGSGTLDLTNHDLYISGGGGSLATLQGKIFTSTAGPNINGPTTTTIALLTGSDYMTLGKTGNVLDTTATVTSGDLVGVLAYRGDANLDGKIGPDDYLALDVGYMFNLSGWTHGDFDQDGTVGVADFAYIDNNYHDQSGSVADGEIALHTQWFGAAYTDALAALNAPAAVPEPASLTLLLVGALSLLRRKK